MAQKVQVLLVDDVDGGEADETVTFAIDDVTYEIDLSNKNADKLRQFIDPWKKAARRTGGRTAKGKAARGNTSDPDTSAIREWAKSKGYEGNDRGRVPATIREAYEKAHA